MRTVPEIIVGSATIAIVAALAIYFAGSPSPKHSAKCVDAQAHIAFAVAKKGC